MASMQCTIIGAHCQYTSGFIPDEGVSILYMTTTSQEGEVLIVWLKTFTSADASRQLKYQCFFLAFISTMMQGPGLH